LFDVVVVVVVVLLNLHRKIGDDNNGDLSDIAL